MCGHSDLLLALLKPSSTVILCPGRAEREQDAPKQPINSVVKTKCLLLSFTKAL